MLSIEKAQEIIEIELDRLSIPSKPEMLYEPVRYILANGGKRLRPALVLLACDLFGSDYKKAINPALGIEVFHNFTLLHDDLMDSSIIRRNKPTVHVKWDPNTAILSGDVMSILASSLISNIESDVIVPVTRMFNKTALEVCEGQMLDMEYSKKENISVSEYVNMIQLKTSVLIAGSLGIGALIAGASDNDTSMLYNFGLNLGLAFQIQDDLLDSFGNEEKFGKKIGNDILTNKKTFLLVKAFETAKGEDLVALRKYFSEEDFDPREKIDSVKLLFNKLDIKKTTENQIMEYNKVGMEYLNKLNVSHEKKRVLTELSQSLLKREK